VPSRRCSGCICATSATHSTRSPTCRRPRDVAHDAPDDRRVRWQRGLEQRRLASGELEQLDDVAHGDLLLDELSDRVGRADEHVDAHVGLIEPRVGGVLHASHHLRHAELELGQARDDQVVLVVAGGRDHDVHGPDRAAFEERGLRRVAVDHGGSRLLASAVEPGFVEVDDGHLVAGAHEDAGQVAADVAPTGDEHLHPRIPRKDSKRR
jgi:hypothetical protein